MRRGRNEIQVSRRSLIKSAGATLIVAAVTPAGMVLGRSQAWAATPQALKPETFAALVQMSRDIYPHDRLEDRFYAAAVSTLDSAAKADVAAKDMLEKGVEQLDGISERMGRGKYVANAQEDDRLAVLRQIDKQDSAFFQKVRGNLITGIYNNKEVWPLFGYEGESASKGGYVNRGFNDLDWL